MRMPSATDPRRLYGDLVWLWPIISPPEEYGPEAAFAMTAILDEHRGGPSSLLHLGCGGGHLDLHLKKRFRVTGVDLSGDMLSLASRLNPEVRYIRGDMRTVRLEERFDAVLALDSMNYMLSEEELDQAFSTAYASLRPGGVFVTYVEFAKERFAGTAGCSQHAAEGTVVTFFEDLHDPDPEDTTFEYTFLFLIRRRGMLEVEGDRHLQGLFPTPTWSERMRGAGFEVRERSDGPDRDGHLTWLVGRRP